MKYLSVDRIEGDIAVCLDDEGTRFPIPICDVDLASPIREGDMLVLTENGTLLPDPAEKQRRQEAMLQLLKKAKG